MSRLVCYVCLTLLTLFITSCGSSRGMKTADSQASSNAASAGLGVLVYGLITNDKDALEKAAASAAAAATVTKVKEGSASSREEGEWERVIGKENTDALVALIQRDYRAAKNHIATASKSDKPEYQRASRWLSALIDYETGNDEALSQCLPKS